MDVTGIAWPSIATLATATALTTRAVGKHLQEAEHLGWIKRKLWRDNGKDWAQYRYVASIPSSTNGAEPSSLPSRQGEESGADGAEPENSLVPNDVPTNSVENSTKNSTTPLLEINGKAAKGPGWQHFKKMVEERKQHFHG